MAFSPSSRQTLQSGKGVRTPDVGGMLSSAKHEAEMAGECEAIAPDAVATVPVFAHAILHRGFIIKAANGDEYKFREPICYGQFGDLYKCERQRELYAVRVEAIEHHGLGKLQTIAEFMWAYSAAERNKRKHFIRLHLLAKNDDFRFIVCQYVGPTLIYVRKTILGTNFSHTTALKICMQMLQAIEDVHGYGFVHRNIRPAAFSIGVAKYSEQIFLTSMSRCRRIKRTDGKFIPKRNQVLPKASRVFASRKAYELEEYGRGADIESWLYTCFDVFDDKALPWRTLNDEEETYKAKCDLFSYDLELMTKVFNYAPPQFGFVLEHIDGLDYTAKPNYRFLNQTLDQIAMKYKARLHRRPEWVKEPYKVTPRPRQPKTKVRRIVFSENEHSDAIYVDQSLINKPETPPDDFFNVPSLRSSSIEEREREARKKSRNNSSFDESLFKMKVREYEDSDDESDDDSAEAKFARPTTAAAARKKKRGLKLVGDVYDRDRRLLAMSREFIERTKAQCRREEEVGAAGRQMSDSWEDARKKKLRVLKLGAPTRSLPGRRKEENSNDSSEDNKAKRPSTSIMLAKETASKDRLMLNERGRKQSTPSGSGKTKKSRKKS